MKFLTHLFRRARPSVAPRARLHIEVLEARVVPALTAYEPFLYPAANLAGGNGGSGFKGAWTTPAAGVTDNQVTSPGMYTVQGGSIGLEQAGNKVVTRADNNVAIGSSSRTLITPLTLSDKPIWISFLASRDNTKDDPYKLAEGGFVLDTAEHNRRILLGDPGGDFWGLTNNLGTTTVDIHSAIPGIDSQTHLLVYKLTKSAGTGNTVTIDFFQDPDLKAGVPPQTSNITFHLNSIYSQFTQVDVATVSEKGVKAAVNLDELRIGTTFADVTPHGAIPTAPSITVKPNAGSFTVLWGAVPNATSYDVYGGPVGKPVTLLASTPALSTNPIPAQNGATWGFYVVAKNAYGPSPASTTQYGTTTPSPATNLKAISTTTQFGVSIKLTANLGANNDPQVLYKLERRYLGGPWGIVPDQQVQNQPSLIWGDFLSSGAKHGYEWRVTAVVFQNLPYVPQEVDSTPTASVSIPAVVTFFLVDATNPNHKVELTNGVQVDHTQFAQGFYLWAQTDEPTTSIQIALDNAPSSGQNSVPGQPDMWVANTGLLNSWIGLENHTLSATPFDKNGDPNDPNAAYGNVGDPLSVSFVLL